MARGGRHTHTPMFLSCFEYTIGWLSWFINSSFHRLPALIHRLAQLKIIFVLYFIFKSFFLGILFTHVDIYFRFWSWFRMVLQLGLDAQLTHNESMISITVCTMEALCDTDTLKVNPSCQNDINLVAMLRPGMTPWYLVLILQSKGGVCYCKITDGAEL